MRQPLFMAAFKKRPRQLSCAIKEDDLLTMRQYGRNVVIYTDAIHRADEKNSM